MNDADDELNVELDTMFDTALQSFLKRKCGLDGMHWVNHRSTRFGFDLASAFKDCFTDSLSDCIHLHSKIPADSLKL